MPLPLEKNNFQVLVSLVLRKLWGGFILMCLAELV